MRTIDHPVIFADEAADFWASRPTREGLLRYRLAAIALRRLNALLRKQRTSTLTRDESQELSQFQQTEILLRPIKAQLRQRKARP